MTGKWTDQGGYLGNLLLEKGLITREQLQEAIEEQKRTGKLMGLVLVDLGFVKEQDVYHCLGLQLGMETVDPLTLDIPKEVLKKVSPSMVRIYGIIPIRTEGDDLVVALSNPLNPHILDDLRFMLDTEVRGVLASEEKIKEAIKKHYGEQSESIADLIAEIEKEIPGTISEEMDLESLQDLIREAPVIKLLNLILSQAIKEKASDIHFEPFEDEFKVRYRVDGVLYEMTPPPKHLSLALASRIKVLANLDIAERRLPQDGRILMSVEGRTVDLRISSLPTAFGESVVIRVLDQSVVGLDLGQLGMNKATLAGVQEMLERPSGIIIVTGPTGSGKTTTLYAGLKRLNTIDSKLITTEDPIEYDVDGLIQVAVNEEIGLTFAQCLRSILRQDPDIIMVGEIRDLDTAQISIQSSLTGHLVFSTLHTNDATGALIRLIDMGVEPYLICSTLEAILAQRLVRKICPQCKTEFVPDAAMLATVDLEPEDVRSKKFHYGKGCVHCNHTGYRGRTGIFEFLLIREPLRNLILSKAPAVSLRAKALELGMRTLREDGLEKVFDGITTLEEVARET